MHSPSRTRRPGRSRSSIAPMARCTSSAIPMAEASRCARPSRGRIASPASRFTSHRPSISSGRWALARLTRLRKSWALAARTAEGVITGNYRGAAASFVDYWSGRGAWAALRPSVQAALTRWMPKAPLDFRALDRRRTRSLRRRRLPAECRRGPCVRIQSSLFMAAAEAPTTRRISLALDSTAGTTDPVRRFGGHTNGDFRENISCSRPGEQACDPPQHSLPKRCS